MFSYFKAKIYRDFFTNLLFYRQIRAKTLERYNGEFVDHPASLKCGKKKTSSYAKIHSIQHIVGSYGIKNGSWSFSIVQLC